MVTMRNAVFWFIKPLVRREPEEVIRSPPASAGFFVDLLFSPAEEMNIVTYRPIVRQRLSKYIPAEAKALNSRASIARQRISKHASLTIEAVISA
jgi:hypothetical protein